MSREIPIVIMFALLCFVLGAIMGAVVGFSDYKDEAVRQGKAEYYLDQNHKRRWRWKP